jgi:hypothetical protein
MKSWLRPVSRVLLPAVLVAGVVIASYAAPVKLSGISLATCTYTSPIPTVTNVSPNSGPQAGGTVVTVTGTDFCNGSPTVSFGGVAGTSVILNSNTQLTVTSPAHGLGTVDVLVTTAGGTSAVVTADHFTYLPAGTCSSVTASASPASPQLVGTPVTVTASATCTNPGPSYQFWLLAPNASSYVLVQAYSTSNVFNWNTTTEPVGTFSVAVWAKDVTSSGTSSNSSGSWDAYFIFSYTLTAPAGSFCTAVGLSGAPPSMAGVGTAVTFTATASCPHASPVFQFWTLAPGAGAWTLAQAYSTTKTFSWTTTGLKPGAWQIAVWVRDASSTGLSSNASGTWDAAAFVSYTLTTCGSVSISGAPPSTAGVGTTVTFTASSVGCPNAAPMYQFWVLAQGASSWTLARAYSSVATFAWNTTGLKPGSWQIAVWVRDASSAGASSNSTGTWDAAAFLNYTLTTCTSVSLSAAPPSTAARGATVTFTPSAMGCPNPAPMYQFWVLAPGASSWTLARAYSSTAAFAWNTTGLAAGTYQVDVWARDAASAGTNSNSTGTWDVYTIISYTLT